MNETFRAIVDGKDVQVDSNLQDYTILKRTSSFVDYIAVKDDNLFIQFSKGNCALFSAVPMDVIRAAISAPSIGKFYHASIKDKFDFINVGHGNKCIVEAPVIIKGQDFPEDFDDDDIEEGGFDLGSGDYDDEY